MAKRKMTANRGAADRQSAIIDIILRMPTRAVQGQLGATRAMIDRDSLIAKIRGSAKRASARAGGLGRKQKK